jgi:dTDP-4-dehydrorhamnose 3,5-epimerase-like enzyme
MKILESYKQFTDSRGMFLGIVNSGQWEEVNYIETKAGQVRGGHYHKETRELFFIIEGEIDITIQDLRGNHRDHITAKKGSLFIIDPYEVHTFTCKTACKWLNILSKRIDSQFHDIHIPEARQ